MSFASRIIKVYFDFAYNRVYDHTTARLRCYQELQQRCISKLDLRDNDQVLCIGVGTGNEIIRICEMNSNVNVTGVDYSDTALQKLRRKALRVGKEIDTAVMDARCLDFATGSFDKVVCIHVMDFITEVAEATSEIIRVLKDGGQFVITYPSEIEGAKLGSNIVKDSFHQNIKSGNYLLGLLRFTAQLAMGVAYLPLILRQKACYSQRELHVMLAPLISEDFQIEEYSAYQDFIVYGKKNKSEGE